MKNRFWILIGVLAGIFIGGFGVYLITKKIQPINPDSVLIMLSTIFGLVMVAFITLMQSNQLVRNQNKQVFRPFLKFHLIEKSKDSKNSDVSFACCSKSVISILELKEPESFYFDLLIRNEGNGPATNICFYDCNTRSFIDKTEVKQYTFNPKLHKGEFSSHRIGAEKKINENFRFSYQSKEQNEDYVQTGLILVLYSDIEANIYKALIKIIFEFDKNKMIDKIYNIYYEENLKFIKNIKNNNLKLKIIERKYLRKQWNSK